MEISIVLKLAKLPLSAFKTTVPLATRDSEFKNAYPTPIMSSGLMLGKVVPNAGSHAITIGSGALLVIACAIVDVVCAPCSRYSLLEETEFQRSMLDSIISATSARQLAGLRCNFSVPVSQPFIGQESSIKENAKAFVFKITRIENRKDFISCLQNHKPLRIRVRLCVVEFEAELQ